MAESPFWVNEVYSLGYWLKDYAYYPKHWTLYNYMDHGNTFSDTIPTDEKENNAPFIFKFSPRLVAEYKTVSKKPVYGIVNPIIHCRRVKKIEQQKDAKGTLFYVAHSTDMIDDKTNWDSFIATLDNIPDKFKPIDICLHNHDIIKGLDKIFEYKGYKVFSSGDPLAIEFAEKMYTMLMRYQFTMSNILGSYLFYSVEMGIPFSLFGPEPDYFNKGDMNMELGIYSSYKNQPTHLRALKMFSGFHTVITSEQNDFVNFELGKYHTISRFHTAALLYTSAFWYNIKRPFIGLKNLAMRVYQRVKRIFLTAKIAGQGKVGRDFRN